MDKGSRRKAGRTKKDATRAKAEKRKHDLIHIWGIKPNPCEMQCEIRNFEATAHYRFHGCPSYDVCLNVACVGNWPSFTCRACAIYRRYYDRWTRIIRRTMLDEATEKRTATTMPPPIGTRGIRAFRDKVNAFERKCQEREQTGAPERGSAQKENRGGLQSKEGTRNPNTAGVSRLEKIVDQHH